ncbi:hypothetical protein [Myxococcus sp. AM009]|uniref:hypothetical protein n=1 Tax=Myxococcus sp. AM009 TaxID=2745137 RepID=UPI0020CEA7B7|nr:hypothetical protein [Myxococcus sp. AM009]
MTTKKSVKRALCMAVVMTVSGCRAPAALGPGGGMSASEGSDSGASSEGSNSGASSEGSDSGASSEGSGESSQSDSGASSEGSGDSSQSESSGSSGEEGSSQSESSGSSGEEGSSQSESSGSSEEGSSHSESSGSSEEGASHSESSDNESTEVASRSSEEGGTSEGSAGTEKADGEASRSRSDNSSQSNNNDVASAVTVAALVVGLGIIIWQAYAAAERRRRGVSPKEAGRAAQVYLRARTHQLREDLALGAGPTVEDLAAAARIRREHLGLFGRVLRANRKELLEMAEASTLTPDRALAWLERVGELARAEPRLEEDRRAFLAAPALEGTATVAH